MLALRNGPPLLFPRVDVNHTVQPGRRYTGNNNTTGKLWASSRLQLIYVDDAADEEKSKQITSGGSIMSGSRLSRHRP